MQQRNYTYQSDFAKKYVAEGYRAVLRTLLEQRFGELPADAIARVDEADADTLDAWGAGCSPLPAWPTSSPPIARNSTVPGRDLSIR
jgi:hypothetical protein